MFSKQSRTSCKDKILLCTNQYIWRENEYLKLQRLFFIHKLHMSFTLHNKRPMGHIAHLRKQFKSLNKYDDSENKEKTLWVLIGSSFEQTWIPFTQGCFVPSLVEIGPVVLKKKMKMWKVYRQTDGRDRQTDGQIDDGRQVIRKAHLSFQLRRAKNNGLECRGGCQTDEFLTL